MAQDSCLRFPEAHLPLRTKRENRVNLGWVCTGWDAGSEPKIQPSCHRALSLREEGQPRGQDGSGF